jgi:hypothetical protein
MAVKNQALTVVYYAFNTSTGAYVTGDVANHTVNVVTDGTDAAATNTPLEVDATNQPGAYKVTLTAAEMNGNLISWGGKSSTSNVILVGGEVATDQGKFGDVETDTQDIQTQIGTAGAGLTDLGGMSTGMKAEVNTEVDSGIETYHLDHLLAVDYDPASPPGTATALLNELVESDLGVSRFTANALEQAPGGSAPSAADIADAVWDEVQADHTTVGTFGEMATETSSIQAVTDLLPDGGALTTIDTNIDSILADTGTDGVAISATTANEIADALLNRDMSAVSDTNARSPINALRFLRNKYSVAGATLTVTKEDDSTTAWTSTLTTDAAADPVTGSDPA